jgi:hypothetical protein
MIDVWLQTMIDEILPPPLKLSSTVVDQRNLSDHVKVYQ